MVKIFAELLISILLGIFFGIITGLTPGLHINLIAVILFGISPLLLGYTNALVVAGFIIAMSITHTFTDFIAAVYLGAPADDTALSVLPGHRLLLKGMGHEAVKLSVIGSLLALIFTILLVPLLVIITPLIFNNLKSYIAWILIGIIAYMILRSEDWNLRFWSFLTYLLSGILGVVVFGIPNLEDPLLPMLSGLFGVSMLLMSLSNNVSLPLQRETEMINVKGTETAKAIASSVFSGSLISIFPGLGPAQAAVLGSQLVRKISMYAFIILVGGINTVSMIMSLITLFVISKARNGSIVVVQKLLQSIDLSLLMAFLMIALVTGCLAAVFTLKISKIFSKIINKMNYKLISISIITFITGLVFYFSGYLGVLILSISTAIGLIPNILNVNRSNLMGCLLMPVILYYLL